MQSIAFHQPTRRSCLLCRAPRRLRCCTNGRWMRWQHQARRTLSLKAMRLPFIVHQPIACAELLSNPEAGCDGFRHAAGGQPAGIGNMMAFQMAKKSLEQRRDLEATLLANQGQAAGNTTTARKVAFVQCVDFRQRPRGANGADSTAVTAAATDGTAGDIRTLTETIFKGRHQGCFEDGGQPTMALVGAFNKQVISGFTGRSSSREMVSEDKISVPHRSMRPTTATSRLFRTARSVTVTAIWSIRPRLPWLICGHSFPVKWGRLAMRPHGRSTPKRRWKCGQRMLMRASSTLLPVSNMGRGNPAPFLGDRMASLYIRISGRGG